MKIKRKVQKNLPQLIEYVQENIDIARNKIFKVKGEERHSGVYLNYDEDGIRLSGDIKFTDTFTVEVEETITEDTVFENLIEIYKTPEDMKFSIAYRNVSINYVENDHYLKTLAIYILNDDLTMTLIWRNGKMVE